MSEDRQLSLRDFDQKDASESGNGAEATVDIAGWPAGETGYDIPCKLLGDLRSGPNPGKRTELCSPVAEYLASHQYSEHARDAASTLELILKNASTPVDCPELLGLVNHRLVDLEILLEHLLEIYPKDEPSLPNGLTIEVTDDMGVVNRFRVYRLMSFLPPDMGIFSQLDEAKRELGDEVPIPGWDEDTQGTPREWARRYARRVVELYSKYPGHVSDDLVTEVSKRYPVDHDDGK